LQGAALYDPDRHHAHAFRYGNDPGLVCHAYAAEALWCLGRDGEARDASAAAVELAHRLGHPFSRAQALALAGMLAQLRDAPDEGLALADRILPETAERSFPYWHSVGVIIRCWARSQLEGTLDAADEIDRAIAAYRATGATLAAPRWLVLEAQALGGLGREEPALERLAQAEAHIERTGERYFLAELLRTRADLLAASGACGGAEAAYRQAIAVATAQGARPWIVRATEALAAHLSATAGAGGGAVHDGAA
jgi:predicted ATPase